MKTKNKLIILSAIIIVVIVGIVAVLVVQSKQWEQDISISGGEWVANGYKNGAANGGSMLDVVEKGNPYYNYKITNETNHSMNNVVIVFEVEGKGIDNKKWTYEFDVGYLLPGQTKEIKVYHWDMHPEGPDVYWSTSHNVKKVTYQKG